MIGMKRPHRWLRRARISVQLLVGLLAGLCPATLGAAAPERPPNILFVLADDLGYGDLGCYGQKVIRTPNIDRLADEGIRFTDCYAGSTVCAPSRCALMTGFHMGHALIRGNARHPLRPDDITVAEVLKNAGYTSALIGKWGLGEEGSTGLPTRQGFDSFFGYLNQRHAHNYYPAFLVRDEKRVPLKNVVPDKWKAGAGVADKKIEYSHDLLIDDALTFLDRNKDADRPFFLYLALTIPHANNEAGNKGMEVPDLSPYTDRDWPDPQKAHAAMITRMDADVGRIMNRLKQNGLDENTIVFFSSDNGPHREGGADPDFFNSSGPLRGIKRDLYEGGIRVPMIVRWPGKAKAGSVSDQVWASWDFLPTAAELAGVEPPDGIDGISMAPAILGRPQKNHDHLYWEFHERGFKQAVRTGPWKGVRLDPSEPIELYHLPDDIGEKNDVAAEHPDIVKKIETIFAAARVDSELWPIRAKRKAAAKASAEKRTRKRKPNVLFLAVDDLNDWTGRLGGYRGVQTPNLDRLADRGVLFTRAYCGAPACNPSRVSLLTGLRPSTTGVYHNSNPWRPVLPDVVTLPQHFQAAGYHVVGGGKIFHGRYRDDRSWHKYFARPDDPVPPVRPVNGLPNTAHFDWGPLEVPDADMSDTKVADWAIRYLKQTHDKPFFLAVGLFRPHLPWYVPRPYFEKYPIEKITLPEVPDDDLDDVPPIGRRMANPGRDHKRVIESDNWEKAVQGYLASITYADTQIGRLLDALDRSPYADNTIIVMWSDHGWHLGEKKHWRKFALWEEATRVPMIFAVPGVTQAGGRCAEPASLLDIYPTLIRLCALPDKPELEGESLLPFLRDPDKTAGRIAVTTHGRNNHAARSAQYRYIRYSDGTEELYDHQADPMEWTNLADRSDLSAVKNQLAAALPTKNAAEVPSDRRRSSGKKPASNKK